jgi:hypothetical protein
MSKGKPRNTRGAISDLYLSELAELSPDERENRLVFGDTLASDFAKYEQTATDIEGDVEPNPLTLIHQELIAVHERPNQPRPSNFLSASFLAPMLSALENHDADFFNAIARLVEWHQKNEPKNNLHIGLIVLRNRDGLKSGTLKEIEDGLTKLRASGKYSEAMKLPDRKTTKAACERVGIEVLKDLPGRR